MFPAAGFRKYLVNTSWLFLEQVVRIGVALVTGIYVARYLGEALFGQLNYATGFVGIFLALTSMGLDEIVVRDLVRHPGRRNELLGTSALIKLGGALVLLTLVVLATWARDMDGLTSALIVIIAIGELLKPLSVVHLHFMAEVRAGAAVRVQLVQVLLSAGFKFLLIGLGAPLIFFAWAYVLDSLLQSAGLLLQYHAEGLRMGEWRFRRAVAVELLGQSWPLVIYGLALYVQARIDQVMLGDMLGRSEGKADGFAEVGQYSVALKMIEAFGFLPVVVQKSLAPAVTRAKEEDPLRYEERLVNLYRLMFLLFLVTAIPLYLVAEPLIVFLYGEEFQPAGFLLSLFAIRLFFTNMGVAKASFITNEDLFRYSLFTALVGAGVNIGMNYLLIPSLRSIGAIWATIGSFLVSLFLLDLLFPRTRTNLKWMCKGMLTFWRLHRVS